MRKSERILHKLTSIAKAVKFDTIFVATVYPYKMAMATSAYRITSLCLCNDETKP